jgi:hypothetical protein
MRMRDRWPPLDRYTEKALGDTACRSVAITLHVSRPNPSGAVHTPLREFPLGLPRS